MASSSLDKGRIEYYRSKMDGEERPYTICATGDIGSSMPLIVEVSPAGTNFDKTIPAVEKMAAFAKAAGKSCVIARPTGRGPGSVYQNYGEVDTFEVIEDVKTRYPIDPDRISVTGASMGGAATWYLISHYPDYFSAGAPFCGYCDYSLWEKPGGSTFHMHEWEEPSWQSRSAAFLPENFAHTPMWIVHGEWDRSVGGGVPTEHSRQMHRLLEEQGCDVRYTELPKMGHSCRTDEIFSQVVPWLLEQKKSRNPDHIKFATYSLRHNRSYWVAIEQLQRYGAQRATVEAQRTASGAITVTTGNIRALSLGPLAVDSPIPVEIDGQSLAPLTPDTPVTFLRKPDGHWAPVDQIPSGEKHHTCSGPFGDLFHDHTILVPGATGSDADTHFNQLLAINAAKYYSMRNGGVHRGGIMGENNVQLPIIPDSELTDEQRAYSNLLLFGTPDTNSIFNHYRDSFPLSFRPGVIELCGHTWTGNDIALITAFPHPENPQRYIALNAGVTPHAATWSSHFDLALLPDYLIYNRNELLAWGHYDNQWKPQD